MPLLDPLACACPLCTKEERGRHYAGWRLPGTLGRHGLRHGHLVRYPALISPPPREPALGGRASGGAVSSASRGLAPREGLEPCVDEDGPRWALIRATPQAAGRQVWGPPFPERRQRASVAGGCKYKDSPTANQSCRGLQFQISSSSLIMHSL